MQTLEHVSITLTMVHPRRGNVEIVLLCPSSMSSLIGARRPLDTDASGYSDWTFSTVRCWGETAQGQYSLLLSDHSPKESKLTPGYLKHWKLTLYGSSMTSQEVQERRRVVEEAMGGQYLDSSFSLPCPADMNISLETVSPFTSNSLKSLLLLGCFALFWSLYYMLEVTIAPLDPWEALCRGGRRTAGAPGDSSELEMLTVRLDSEDKVPFITADRDT